LLQGFDEVSIIKADSKVPTRDGGILGKLMIMRPINFDVGHLLTDIALDKNTI
jgi:hypothetical protein